MTRGGYLGTLMSRPEHVAIWLRTPQDAANLHEELDALGWERVHRTATGLTVYTRGTRFAHIIEHTRTAEAWWSHAGGQS